ncbi:MAG TPA: hypothetical protein DEH22_09370 [Chloroflexi bacterium]|nr:hypothetical protein [Chloroflexota bacterium]
MRKFTFPETRFHLHAPIRNVNELFDEQITPGQRASDWIAKTIGSWRFIIIQTIFFSIWIFLNVTAFIKHWDPYPFILMNLLLSTQAAYTAPMIMMSQNRQAVKDRLEAHNDYVVNQKAEVEIRTIMEQLEAQNQVLLELHRLLAAAQDNVQG